MQVREAPLAELVQPEAPWGHAFVPSGTTRRDKRDRALPVCAVCDRPNNSPRHRLSTPAIRIRRPTRPNAQREARATSGHAFVWAGQTMQTVQGKVFKQCALCHKQQNAPRHWIRYRPTPVVEPLVQLHAFVANGEHIDARGRHHPICGECGKAQQSKRHIRASTNGTHQEEAPRTGVGIPVMAGSPLPDSRPKARPKPIHEYPREVIQLAYALDAAIDLPVGAFEWRSRLRAVELRATIDFVPKSGGEAWRQPTDSERSTGEPVAAPPVDEELLKPLPEARIERVEPSVRSRARAMTKSIKDHRHRELATRAVTDGWNLKRTGSGHWRLEKGDQALVFAQTGSDHRGWLNCRARARRLGIDTEGL